VERKLQFYRQSLLKDNIKIWAYRTVLLTYWRMVYWYMNHLWVCSLYKPSLEWLHIVSSIRVSAV